ncbi:MAG: hypothetical protein C5B57_12230 [Blastocatellia bacterium]|nr:MAG: hypothetical protein C5B57_12230 [Blastocatellia bacterium]
MKLRRFGLSFDFPMIGVLALLCFVPSRALAQIDHGHALNKGDNDRAGANALVKVVRESTERFKDVALADAEGYKLQFGCVSGPDSGAMGLHFVNGELVGDGEIDATRPEIVIYEPLPNGRLRLIGADYLVLADAWNATHDAPPELMGQLFHLFESPNRFRLPSFYTLHVWAWKENPTGTFVNWHANVSCDAFNQQP